MAAPTHMTCYNAQEPPTARARAATADGATVAGPLRLLLPEAKMDNIPNGKDLIAAAEEGGEVYWLQGGISAMQVSRTRGRSSCRFFARFIRHIFSHSYRSYRQANHCESLIKCTDDANSSI